MSDLPTFLTPYSHWILAHRNTVIVVLALVLFAVACHSLIARWRVEGLERALAQARTAARTSTKRTYSPGQEEQVEEGSSLPPVRGGRSYARNLGTALQKAGGPQIYSPPTPTGWAPNVTPGHQPPSPWGSPSQAPGPWQFIPAGQGSRPGGPMPPAGPNPRLYPGPAGAAPGMPPVAPGQPPTGPGAGPQAPFYSGPPAAPGTPGPVGPAFPGMPGPAATPPSPTFPAFPGASPATPPMAPGGAPAQFPQPVPPGMGAPMGVPGFPGEPTADVSAGRGKSKRRRFNLSVLENIEKMVQSAAAGVVNQASAMTTPPPAPAAPPITPAAPVSPAGDKVSAPSAFGPFAAPAPSIPAPSIASPAAPPQEPTLPLDSTPAAETIEPAAEETAPSMASDTAPQQESASVTPAPEVETEHAVSKETDQRSSMRSMMFGEEHPAPRPSRYGRRYQYKPEPKPVVQEPQPPAADAEPVGAASAPAFSEPEQPVTQSEDAATAEAAVQDTTVDQPSVSDAPSGLGEYEEPSFTAAGPTEAATEPDQSVEVSRGSWEADETTFSSTLSDTSMDEPASTTSEISPEETHASSEADGDHAEPSSFSSDFGEPTESSTMAESGTPSADETPQGSGPTMVIIEDDESVAQYYATLFRGNGYRVEVAHDGVSGVDLCSKVQPAVILLDVMMPRQNGILVLQTLRASDETRETPVVVLSNFSEPTLIKRALQLGALEYVIKTQVEGAALLAAIPRWLNREKAFAA